MKVLLVNLMVVKGRESCESHAFFPIVQASLGLVFDFVHGFDAAVNIYDDASFNSTRFARICIAAT